MMGQSNSVHAVTKGWQQASQWTLLQQLLSAGCSLVIAIVTARTLGPTQQGYLAVWLSLAWFGAMMAGAGFGSASVLLLAQNQYPIAHVVLGSSALVLLLALFTGAGSSLAAWWMMAVPSALEARPLGMWAMLWLVPGLALQLHMATLLSGLNQFRYYNIVMLLSPLATCVLLLGLVGWQQLSLATTLHAYGVGLLLSLIGNGAYLFLSAIDWRQLLKPTQTGFLPALLRLAWQAHLATVLMYAVYRIDTLLLQWFWPGEQIGHFHLATTIAERVWMLSQAVGVILLPGLARAKQDPALPMFVLQTAYKVGLWSLLPVVAIATTCSYWLPWLFGQAYQPAIGLLYMLLPGIWLFGIGRIVANGIAAQGRLDVNVRLSGLLLLLVLCCNGIATKYYGVVGAALATSCAYAMDLCLRLWVYRRLWQLDWSYLFWPFDRSKISPG